MEKELLELSDTLTPKEVCLLIGISNVTLWKYVKKGYLKRYSIADTRIVRYSRKEVNQLFNPKKTA